MKKFKAVAGINLQPVAMRHVQAMQDAVVNVPDPEAVHALRVGVKRLRCCWQLVADGLPTAGQAKLAVAELRKISELLAPTRDLQVHNAVCSRYLDAPATAAAGAEKGERCRVSEAQIAALEPIEVPAIGADRVSELSAHILAVRGYIEEQPMLLSITSLLASIESSHQRSRKSGRRSIAAHSLKGMHRWRKDIKQLQYELQLLDDRGLHIGGVDRGLLQELGAALGEYRDLQLLRKRLQAISPTQGPAEADLSCAADAQRRQLRRPAREFRSRAEQLQRQLFGS